MPEDVEAQKRIYPKLRRILDRPVPLRVTGVVVLIIDLGVLVWWVVVASHHKDPSLFWQLPWSVVFVIFLGAYTIGVNPIEGLMAIAYCPAWLGSKLTTQAEIVDRIAERHQNEYGKVTYTYWIVLRFDCSRGETVLKAKVSKAQYDRLEEASTVTVRYAAQNPRIALLEGE